MANAVRDLFADKAAEIHNEACRMTEQAIRNWSAQLQVTPEEWLRIYEPEITMKPSGNTLFLTVTARLRPDPFAFELVVPGWLTNPSPSSPPTSKP